MSYYRRRYIPAYNLYKKPDISSEGTVESEERPEEEEKDVSAEIEWTDANPEVNETNRSCGFNFAFGYSNIFFWIIIIIAVIFLFFVFDY